jgi:hypothetical protein
MSKTEEKRNSNPGAVRVLGIADLPADADLELKANLMVENRNEIVIHNLEYILKRDGISQNTMCEKVLGGSPSPSQISLFKKTGSDIPFRTVARIAAAYNYTPEQMYGQLLDQSDNPYLVSKKLPIRPEGECRKYIGTYQLAYFSTEAKPGSNNRSTAKALTYGLLTVYPGSMLDGCPQLNVSAYTNFANTEERDALLRQIRIAENTENYRSISACYEKIAANRPLRAKYLYEGCLTLTEEITEITMAQSKGSDVIHIHLLNRAAHSSEGRVYKGGLGAMLSTSRGAEHQPCVQSCILSRRGFDNLAKEAVGEALRMAPASFDLRDGVQSILDCAKKFFPANGAETPFSALSDEDKEYMLRSYIEKVVTEAIRSNVVSCFKVSAEMDSYVYKKFCR